MAETKSYQNHTDNSPAEEFGTIEGAIERLSTDAHSTCGKWEFAIYDSVYEKNNLYSRDRCN